ncbi:MAG: DUF1929 domain-containing protein [Planctomycetes bacterium]|nr:DUF1929 domain-containing protein [Planctomycetota bacterium]
MHNGGVTHHNDYDQRLVELRIIERQQLTSNTFRLTLQAPTVVNHGACPSEWYMLFVLTPDSHVPIGSRISKGAIEL